MNTNILKNLGKTIKKSPVEFGLITAVFVAAAYAVLPTLSAEAYENFEEAIQDTQWKTQMAVMEVQNESMPYGDFPESGRAEPRYLTTMSISAYNSVPWQTDATPCIGAQGTDICEIYETGENVCAANFVPLGTILQVEGLGECTVRDRMNARYYYRVDWYMGMDIAGARQFGVQKRAVSIYPSA